MTNIILLKSPEVLWSDENEGREIESLISLNNREIKIKIGEYSHGIDLFFLDIKLNKYLKPSGQSGFDNEENVEIENDFYNVLEKMAMATIYLENLKLGDEFDPVEVLSWQF